MFTFKIKLATQKGLEPSTSGVTGQHSNQLSYWAKFNGGNNRDRTCDPLLVRQMLSQLSYASINKFKMVTPRGIEPLLPPWKGGVLTAWPRGLVELHVGVEPTTCWLQVSCSAIEPMKHNTKFQIFFFKLLMVGEDGFEPSKRNVTDLQSAPFGLSGTPPFNKFLY